MNDSQQANSLEQERRPETGLRVTFQDILDAAERIRGHAVRTPLLRSPVLDEKVGGTVLIKAENLQRTGSFKFRGAFNRLNMIAEGDRPKGVVACSSGNHAQGIAQGARLLGMPATIVMPSDAPRIKLDRTRGYGAEVIAYDRATEDRDAIAAEICERTGAAFVHPYNDPGVIAGQGTTGLEIAVQAAEYGLQPEHVLACTGGGGLSSGLALAVSKRLPGAIFHTVEPEAFDDYRRSLVTGERQKNPVLSGSICDALMANSPGSIGFSILQRLAGNGLTVTDDEVLAAVAFAFFELKLVVEPGGAAALAAVLSGKFDVSGKTIALVLTGGNIDPQMLARAVGG